MTKRPQTSGLDALIPKGNDLASGYQEIPVDSIVSNPNQPRKAFNPQELETLVASIKVVGVLQPIAARPAGNDKFQLISGERRWRAAQQAGLEFIPAVIRQVDDEASLEHALIENIHRADLNPLEEAAAYQHLIDEFKLTQESVADRVGKSRATIANATRLLTLPDSIQKYLASGQLSAAHARSLVAIDDQPTQLKLAKRIVEENWTVRQVEEFRQKTTGKAKTKPNKAAGRDQTMVDLEDYLARRLDTKVSISRGAGGAPGKVVIQFADIEDLERIISNLAQPQR